MEGKRGTIVPPRGYIVFVPWGQREHSRYNTLRDSALDYFISKL